MTEHELTDDLRYHFFLVSLFHDAGAPSQPTDPFRSINAGHPSTILYRPFPASLSNPIRLNNSASTLNAGHRCVTGSSSPALPLVRVMLLFRLCRGSNLNHRMERGVGVMAETISWDRGVSPLRRPAWRDRTSRRQRARVPPL